jgi:hypothetical protein
MEEDTAGDADGWHTRMSAEELRLKRVKVEYEVLHKDHGDVLIVYIRANGHLQATSYRVAIDGSTPVPCERWRDQDGSTLERWKEYQ